MGRFTEFKQTITIQILVTAAVGAAVALAFASVAAAKGFVLGSLFSLANFRLMARQVPARLGREPARAGWASFLGVFLRLGLLALPLVLALRHSGLSVIWTILGILNLQFSVLVYGLVLERWALLRGPGLERR